MNPKKIHALTGHLALLMIFSFFTCSFVSALFGTRGQVEEVKLWILRLIPILVVLLATTGIMGYRAGKKRGGKLGGRKAKLMRVVAGNGIFILIPSAYFLQQWTEQGHWGTPYIVLQSLELIAGAVNLLLLLELSVIGRQGQKKPVTVEGRVDRDWL